MLAVRKIRVQDIPLVVNYWLDSDPDFLVGMGVDLAKVPSRKELTQMLLQQTTLPNAKKQSYALIWTINGQAVGHSNINKITFGEEAYMHLHLWQEQKRQKGIGTQFLNLSLAHFFKIFQLKRLLCEPYAHNPAPNKILKKVGFEFIKCYVTIPGSLNFEQEVNRWELTKEKLKNTK
jgi:RimJ/RimL family protein N-acetyltransferase